MLKQNVKPLRISSNPRSFLHSSHYDSVDAVLKELKNCSRRLHIALGAFRDEYQVLERLYYKGKNQHHVTMFWRRVVEIRRFCRRLDDIHIDHTVATLRGSFFSAECASSNTKMMRGSWTHFPEVALVDLVLQRFCLCYGLLEKMQEKLLDSYRSFNLAMQSGAFLQLILTLTAVVSRMGAICKELQEVLQATQDVARCIPGILLSERSAFYPSVQPVHSSTKAPTNTLSFPTINVAEDTVMALGHHRQDFSMSQPEVVEPSRLDFITTPVPTGLARIIVERSVKESEVALMVRKETNGPEHSRKKKRRNPTDEIDDIFGF